MAKKFHKMVFDDRRLKVRELADMAGISKSAVHRISTEILGSTKPCARWVPRLLTVAQNQRREDVSIERLTQFHSNKAESLRRFITMDEIWSIFRTRHEGTVKKLGTERGESAPKKAKTVPSVVIEVAIGEYGISVDKLAIAVETMWKDKEPAPQAIKPPSVEDNTKEPPPPAGFLLQCYLLYKRQLLCLKRDCTLLVVRLLCHLLIGVIFGYLYMGSGYRANGVLANYAYLYGSLLLIVYTGKMAVTLAFPLEMQMLSREHFNRWYRLAPYYISMLLVEIPFQAACAATYLAVSYWLTGQPVETHRILSFMVVSIAASLTAQAWGFFIGATTPVKIAVFAGPIIAVLFSVFGFCIRYMDTPVGFRWIFHISYFRAGFHSLLYTVYGFDRMDLKCDDFYCHYKKPTKFLKEMEISDTNVVNNLVLIIGIGVLMHLLTASALWCKLNRR